jgi:hypothetical protein
MCVDLFQEGFWNQVRYKRSCLKLHEELKTNYEIQEILVVLSLGLRETLGGSRFEPYLLCNT